MSVDFLNLNETTDLTKTIQENREYKLLYLSKWKKVQFKIEISKDSLVIEEMKQVLASKKTNFYTDTSEYKNMCQINLKKE